MIYKLETVELLKNYTTELERRNFSPNTVKTYTGCFSKYLNHFKGRDYRNISDDDIKLFLKHCVDKDKISSSYQNQLINAIKFYYEQILHRPRKTYFIERPRREEKLPDILSQNEIRMIFSKCVNIKHKAILILLYSAGLREGEIINLKIENIDSQRMIINIKKSKGFKDRVVPLSEKALLILREYFKEYKPVEYLFNGQFSSQYSATSIQQIVKQLANAAGIKKRVYPHLIRHCFATHSYESGTDLSLLQKVLGHKDQKSTMIYTHLSNRLISQMKTPDLSL